MLVPCSGCPPRIGHSTGPQAPITTRGRTGTKWSTAHGAGGAVGRWGGVKNTRETDQNNVEVAIRTLSSLPSTVSPESGPPPPTVVACDTMWWGEAVGCDAVGDAVTDADGPLVVGGKLRGAIVVKSMDRRQMEDIGPE